MEYLTAPGHPWIWHDARPEIVLASEVKAGRLVQVLTQYEGLPCPMHIVYPPTRRSTAKLRSFVDAMVAELGY